MQYRAECEAMTTVTAALPSDLVAVLRDIGCTADIDELMSYNGGPIDDARFTVIPSTPKKTSQPAYCEVMCVCNSLPALAVAVQQLGDSDSLS